MFAHVPFFYRNVWANINDVGNLTGLGLLQWTYVKKKPWFFAYVNFEEIQEIAPFNGVEEGQVLDSDQYYMY